MKSDYDLIKKIYGERMAKACRALFPTFLDTPGVLSDFLLSRFEPNPSLYDDLMKDNVYTFKSFVFKNLNMDYEKSISNKSVRELLSEAGYDLFECHNEREIQSFRRFYSEGEELCTFKGNRLSTDYVFFAIKKNVDDIRRSDYPNPQRQDEYGTSVISIQFSKGDLNDVSIKNRYNHSVLNPDATFNNNLENIIPGLTDAFEREYGFNVRLMVDSALNLSDYVVAADGRYYKFNYEINECYYCPNNIIIDSNLEVHRLATDHETLIDYFIFDNHNKNIRLFDNTIEDSFADLKYDRMDISKSSNQGCMIYRLHCLDNKNIVFEVDKANRMLGIGGSGFDSLGDDFLVNNKFIKVVEFPGVKKIGNAFMNDNDSLSMLNLIDLEEVGHDFLGLNTSLKTAYLPNLKKTGQYFLANDLELRSLYLPKLEKTDVSFIERSGIEEVNLPNLRELPECGLSYCKRLKNVFLPKVEVLGDYALYDGGSIEHIILSNVVEIGKGVMTNNNSLVKLSLPSVIKIGDKFCSHNNSLEELDMPYVRKIGKEFLSDNNSLRVVNAPLLKHKELNDMFNYEITEENQHKRAA